MGKNDFNKREVRASILSIKNKIQSLEDIIDLTNDTDEPIISSKNLFFKKGSMYSDSYSGIIVMCTKDSEDTEKGEGLLGVCLNIGFKENYRIDVGSHQHYPSPGFSKVL